MMNWEWPLIMCWAFAGLGLFFMLQARQQAIKARDLNKDTKDAVAAWWLRAGPIESAADMADALAERRDGERRRSF